MSKKWYTNNVVQVLADVCPEGFWPGRLPVSEKTRKKHSINSGWKTMTEEQKANRAKKISMTIRARTEEENKVYSEHLSTGRKGKGLGIEPWNKGKTGLQEAWNKGFHMTAAMKDYLRNVYANLPEAEKNVRREAVSNAHKGKKPWNYGLSYSVDPATVKKAKQKEIATKLARGNYGTSSLEEYCYGKLLELFGEDNISRQYFDKKRYPFCCDFYIKPLDLFLEINGNWTHGFTPYMKGDFFCDSQLLTWQEKAKDSDYYKNAIYTWTDLDIRKRNIAVENNLVYFALYSKEEINNFFDLLAMALKEGNL